MAAYIGRFAPSPTGPLHAGSLVAALGSYLDALAHGGQWLLRIDDVDLSRVQAGAAQTIATQLKHYGFAWHANIAHTQDQRAEHGAALARLVQLGYTYPCGCTRADLNPLPTSLLGERIYDRRCQHLTVNPQQTRAIRLCVGEVSIRFTDRWAGEQHQHLPSQVGDFVLWRPESVTGRFGAAPQQVTGGLYTYQLTMPVDDAAAGVSHVVRGADLLGNTARQVLIYDVLGLPRPRYLHLPIVRGADGAKLSKQHGAPALAHLPSTDPLPALNQALVHLGLPPSSAVNLPAFWRDAVRAWTAQWLNPTSTG